MATRQPRPMKTFEVTIDKGVEPYPFEIVFKSIVDTGQPELDAEGNPITETHQFEALGNVGAGGTFAIANLIRYNAKGDQIIDINAVKMFFERVLPDDHYERFVGLLERKDIGVEMDDLVVIFQWLTEEYAGRPTRPSSS